MVGQMFSLKLLCVLILFNYTVVNLKVNTKKKSICRKMEKKEKHNEKFLIDEKKEITRGPSFIGSHVFGSVWMANVNISFS